MSKIVKYSIEEQIEDWCKEQLHNVRYFTKTESINPDIESALKRAPSKKGGTGINYPDIKLLVSNSELRFIPVIIEVKGRKGDFIKKNTDNIILNTDPQGIPNYTNIARYAVNGALHYANAILNYSNSYDEVIAIGVNGYDSPTKRIYEIGVYYVSKNNLFIPKNVGEFSDLSFLEPGHVHNLFEKINLLSLSDSEIEAKKQDLEDDIERKLKIINQRMKDELEIVVGARVQLITGLVMAGLGVKDKVSPLNISELTGEMGSHSNDGVRIMNKISDYLAAKELPQEKISMIEDVLNVVFLHSKLEVPINGVSKLKALYSDVKNNILPFLRGDLHNIDFTGRLFNVLNDWVDVPDGDKNDVVLTPRYVTELMASLCNVNRESYVWDFATGSGGFLISAMHQMIADAKKNITSDIELEKKILHIKMHQLMGIEKLPDIYMLAVLNMILMKDGSTNLIHGDSLRNFEGLYEQGDLKGKPFPANVFLLNPPYSADGKGLVFAEKAFRMMTHGGKAAILIQENAGRGQGLPFSANILKNNTLLASIKMSDIFCGKASVSTAIYVFQVGTPHDERSIVKFIDFSNDGYQRQNRKKSSQRVNLRDVDNAKERYSEIIKLVKYGKGRDNENLKYYKGFYIEDYITLSGTDWTYRQHKPVYNRPTHNDFISVVQNFIKWIVSTILDIPTLKYTGLKFDNLELTKEEKEAVSLITAQTHLFNNFRIGNFFEIKPTKSYGLTNDKLYAELGEVPVVCNSSVDNGIGGFVSFSPKESGRMITYSDTTTSDAIFYQPFDFVGYSHVQGLYPIKDCEEWDENTLLFFVACFRKAAFGLFDYADKFNREIASNMNVSLPVLADDKDCIDYVLMRKYISAVKKQIIAEILSRLQIS